MNVAQRKTRRTEVPEVLESVTKFCPKCGKSVLVGGPHPDDKAWIIQTHGPDPATLCSGTGTHVYD